MISAKIMQRINSNEVNDFFREHCEDGAVVKRTIEESRIRQ